MYLSTLNNNINAIQCLQKDLGVKLNKALTLGISNKDCLEKDNMLITAILRVLHNASTQIKQSISCGPCEIYILTATGNSIITYIDPCENVNYLTVGPVPKPELGIVGSPYTVTTKRGAPPSKLDDDDPITIEKPEQEECSLDQKKCLTDDELCNLIEMAYKLLNENCC